jgi:hypothetical protein
MLTHKDTCITRQNRIKIYYDKGINNDLTHKPMHSVPKKAEIIYLNYMNSMYLQIHTTALKRLITNTYVSYTNIKLINWFQNTRKKQQIK